jgi:tetratricopeptide (TPR) repeat protein
MWSETYDHYHTTALPFAIQDEIARSIVENLRVELEDNPNRQFVRRYTESPEAYDYYLKGRYNLNLRGAALEKAKHWFELALLYDSPTGLAETSGLAPAYVGLADAHLLQGFYGFAPMRSATENARRYVDRALQIDDELAEAYASLGFIETNAANAVEAETAFEKSLELNDRYVNAIHWYASYYLAIGDTERCSEMAHQALELDSISDSTRAVAAWTLAFGEPEEAISVMDETLKRQPGFHLAHFVKGVALLALQQDEHARQSFQAAVDLSGGLPFYQTSLALALARTGRRSEALALLREREAATSLGPYQFSALAGAYLALGDKDHCYEILERSLIESYGLTWLSTVGIYYDSIRTEARFIGIVLAAEQKANR